MKRLFTIMALAALFMTTVANISAQNSCVFKNGEGRQSSISYSDDLMVLHQDDQSVTLISKTEVKPQVKGNAPTHTLNVYFPANWDCNISVSDGTDVLARMFSFQGDYLSVELEEGTYYLFSTGSVTGRNCVWVMDNFELVEDTDINIDFDQCVYSLYTDFVDENGVSLNEVNVLEEGWDIMFSWLGGLTFYMSNISSWIGYQQQVPLIWFTSFNEQSSLKMDVAVEPGDQKSLFYSFEIAGLSEDPVFSNSAEELVLVEEKVSVREGSGPCYYHIDHKGIYQWADGTPAATYYQFISDQLVFNPSQPYKIFSNLRMGDPTPFGFGTILMPAVYECIDWDNPFMKNSYSILTPYYINTEGQVVREALPYFRYGFDMVSLPNWFPETPAMTVNPVGKTTYFGERTPLATYNPVSFRGDNWPLGVTIFSGNLFSSGEHSCERVCDGDQNIKVTIDGEEVFNDSLYIFNREAYTYMPQNVPVVIEVANEHLFANDILKANNTRIEFNMENDDAIPPTMTFLRVLDENGDESISLANLNQSLVVFGCADFTYELYIIDDEYNIRPNYNAMPNVEVLYSIDGTVWLPLNITEDENLFHENHGNVFVADLGQLESRAINQWVSLKFTLTDEAGNTQTQTLENVFYAGEMISVNEHINKGLKHEVYPNPFTNEVRITAAQAVNGVVKIMVHNMLGEQVYNKAENCTKTQDFTIDGSAWKPGVYFYSISTENGVLQGKIVKE